MDSTKFLERFDKMFLIYTLSDGTQHKIPTILAKLSIIDNDSTLTVYTPKSTEGNKYLFDVDNDDFDINAGKFTFDSLNNYALESDTRKCIYQILLALSGATDAIVSRPSGSMAKEGIVLVAISFEK